jgi:adenylosuccinate synthase
MRGVKRHGSCGVGIFDTIVRHREIPLHMNDLWRSKSNLKCILISIARYYNSNEDDPIIENFMRDCEWFANYVKGTDIRSFKDPIFEGAQGLLLSQCNMEMYPHLTPSHCGMRNVRQLCWEGGHEIFSAFYVSRTYLTRHGAGPLPEEHSVSFEDKTNVDSEWQGPLRFAPLQINELERRVHADYENPLIVFTHCDQLDLQTDHGDRWSYGETRRDIALRR